MISLGRIRGMPRSLVFRNTTWDSVDGEDVAVGELVARLDEERESLGAADDGRQLLLGLDDPDERHVVDGRAGGSRRGRTCP